MLRLLLLGGIVDVVVASPRITGSLALSGLDSVPGCETSDKLNQSASCSNLRGGLTNKICDTINSKSGDEKGAFACQNDFTMYFVGGSTAPSAVEYSITFTSANSRRAYAIYTELNTAAFGSGGKAATATAMSDAIKTQFSPSQQSVTVISSSLSTNLNFTMLDVGGSFDVTLAVGSGCRTDNDMASATCSTLLRTLSEGTCAKLKEKAGAKKTEITCPERASPAGKVNFSLGASGVTASKLTLNYIFSFRDAKLSEATDIQTELSTKKSDLITLLQDKIKTDVNAIKNVYAVYVPLTGPWTDATPVTTATGVVTPTPIGAATLPTYATEWPTLSFHKQAARLTGVFKLATELPGDGYNATVGAGTDVTAGLGCSSGNDKLSATTITTAACTGANANGGPTCTASNYGAFGATAFSFDAMEGHGSTQCRTVLVNIHQGICNELDTLVSAMTSSDLSAAAFARRTNLINCGTIAFSTADGARRYKGAAGTTYSGNLISLEAVGGAGRGIQTVIGTGCGATNQAANGCTINGNLAASGDKPKHYWAEIGLRFDLSLEAVVTRTDLQKIKEKINAFMTAGASTNTAIKGDIGVATAGMQQFVSLSAYESEIYYGSIVGAGKISKGSALLNADIVQGGAGDALNSGYNIPDADASTTWTRNTLLSNAATTKDKSSDVLLTRVAARICLGIKNKLAAEGHLPTIANNEGITCPDPATTYKEPPLRTAVTPLSAGYGSGQYPNDAVGRVAGGFSLATGPYKTGVNFFMYVIDSATNGLEFNMGFEILIKESEYDTRFAQLTSASAMTLLGSAAMADAIKAEVVTANTIASKTPQTIGQGTVAFAYYSNGSPKLAATSKVTVTTSAKINLSSTCKSGNFTQGNGCFPFYGPVGTAVCALYAPTAGTSAFPCEVSAVAASPNGTPDAVSTVTFSTVMTVWPPHSNTTGSSFDGAALTKAAISTKAGTVQNTTIPTTVDAAIATLFPTDVKGGDDITSLTVSGAVVPPVVPSVVPSALFPGKESGNPIRIVTKIDVAVGAVTTNCDTADKVVTSCPNFLNALEIGVCEALKAQAPTDDQGLIIPPGTQNTTPNCSLAVQLPVIGVPGVMKLYASMFFPLSQKTQATKIKDALTKTNLTSKKTDMETAIKAKLDTIPVTVPPQKPTATQPTIDTAELLDSTMTEWKVQGVAKLKMSVAGACKKEADFLNAGCSAFRMAIAYGLCGGVQGAAGAKSNLILCPQDGNAKFGAYYPATGFLTSASKALRELNTLSLTPRRPTTPHGYQPKRILQGTTTPTPTDATMVIASGWMGRLADQTAADGVASALQGQEQAMATGIAAAVLTQVNAMMSGASKPTTIGTPAVDKKDITGTTATQSGTPPTPPSSSSVTSFSIACVSIPIIIAACLS